MTTERTDTQMFSDDELRRRLDAWVAAGIVRSDQATRIATFEAAGERAGRSRLGPLTEAISYLGIVLALAAMFATWGQMTDMPGARLALTGLSTLALVVAGWFLTRSQDAGLSRLGAAAWLLATGTVAFAITDVFRLGEDTLPEAAAAAIGAAMATVGWAGYATRHHVITHVAAFIGTVALAAGLGVLVARASGPTPVGVALLVVGAGWYALSGKLVAPVIGVGLASAALVFAPTMFFEDALQAGLLLGVAIAAATTALGIRSEGWLGLAVGGVALFGYTTGAIVRFFGDSLGAPLALLIAGVSLLGAAFVITRLRRPRRGPAPSA